MVQNCTTLNLEMATSGSMYVLYRRRYKFYNKKRGKISRFNPLKLQLKVP